VGSLGIDFKRLVDQLLGNAVVGDVEKACGAAEQTGSICQCLFVLLLAFQGPAYKNFNILKPCFRIKVLVWRTRGHWLNPEDVTDETTRQQASASTLGNAVL